MNTDRSKTSAAGPAGIRVGYFPYKPGTNPYQRLLAQSLEAAGIQVTRIPPRKLAPLQHVARQPVDLLHFDWPHDWYRGRNLATRALKRALYLQGLQGLRGRPVVWTAHNLHAHDSADPEDERRMIQKLIDVCDGMVVMSEASRELLRQEFDVGAGTEVAIVHHGHYIDSYPNQITRAQARTHLRVPFDSRVVLFLGRLAPYKGLEDLVGSFRSVAQSGDILLVAGKSISGDFGRQLRDLVAGGDRGECRIELRDQIVPDEELQIYFNACDVVALPFRQILNSGSLLLAMSFGCPVVAPSIGSVPEVACSDGWFGYDVHDRDGLSRAIGRALAANDLRSRRQRIIAFTARRYSWDRVGERVADLYRSVLHSPKIA